MNLSDNNRGAPSATRASQIAEVVADAARRRDAGEQLSDEQVVAERPDLAPELCEELRKRAIIDGARRRARARPDDQTIESVTLVDADGVSATPAAAIPGYEILGEIHRGGQGVVYEAIQCSTRRRVAIKVLHLGPLASEASRLRFDLEIAILSQLKHPNIVTVHDRGTAGGFAYYVMDYVPGQPLDQHVERRWRECVDIAPSRAAAPPRRTPALRRSAFGADGRSDLRRAREFLREILTLFSQVCDAINAAHLRGVIHRDLKPGNIRVDPGGVPHILDFGLAKVAEHDPMADALCGTMTRTGQFVGSLHWASPEQAAGRPELIDIRTDVYSLGVILFQMLTGAMPYPAVDSVHGLLDCILHADPIRPSAAIASRGAALGASRALRAIPSASEATSDRRLGAGLRGSLGALIDDELDTIVLKCLDKAPERRYQSAGPLRDDVLRYLAGEPIEAKRDSAAYLLRKQLRRHRAVIAVTGGFLAVASAGLATSLSAWKQAAAARDDALAAERAARDERDLAQRAETAEREQRDRAEQNAAAARRAAEKAAGVSGFLQDMLESLDPRRAQGRDLTVEYLLDEAAERLDEGALRAEPDVQIELHSTLGRTCQALGAFEPAEMHLLCAARLADELYGGEHTITLQARRSLAVLRGLQGRPGEAVGILAAALPAARRVGAEHPELLAAILTTLGVQLRFAERFGEAEPLLLEALELQRRLHPDAHIDVAMTLDALGIVRQAQARCEESIAALREALEMYRALLTPPHPDLVAEMNNLAGVLYDCGQAEESESLARSALEMQRELLQPGHPDLAMSIANFATVLHGAGKLDEAETLFREALAMSRERLGEHVLTAQILFGLGDLLAQKGDAEAGEPFLREALEMRRRLLPPDHSDLANAMAGLSLALMDLKRFADAEPLLRECAEIRSRPPTPPWLACGTTTLRALCLGKLERFDETEALILDAVDCVRTDPTAPAAWKRRALERIVQFYEDWKRAEPSGARSEAVERWRAELATASAEQR